MPEGAENREYVMMQARMKALISWLAAAAVTLAAVPTLAQGPDAAENDTTAARLVEMSRIVQTIHVYDAGRGARRPIPMRAEPLHRWSDPTRRFKDGSLWAWGETGRPLALTTLELYPDPPAHWAIELISLSPGPLAADGQGWAAALAASAPANKGESDLSWACPTSNLTLRRIPGAPKPATIEAARLRQVRDLAARFTAHQVNRRRAAEQRYELRLLPRPFYRYSDPSSGLIDGAFFLFVNGTNPEILLMIEAREEGPLAPWSYGLARISRAAPTVLLDRQEVWSQPYAGTTSRVDPYYTVQVPR
jgi:hypothetical protein